MTEIETVDLNKNPTIRMCPQLGDITGELYTPTVLALDPGETSGWSLIQVKMAMTADKGLNLTDAVVSHYHGQVDCFKNSGEFDCDVPVDSGNRNPEAEARGVACIMALADQHPQAAVVIEDFILRSREKTRDLLAPVRITARVDHELWHRNRFSFVQDVANTKSTMSDRRLKEMGRYQSKGGLNHARDADRHALYFLRRCQNSEALRHRAWPHLFEAPVVKSKKRKPAPLGQRINFG